MKKIFYTLFIILLASTVLSASLTGCAPTPESPTPTTSQATETSTSIPPPPSIAPSKPAFTTVEIPGDTNIYTVAAGHAYEVRYGSGILAYVKDIYGNYIKVAREVQNPSDTGLLNRLGSNYVFNSDNTGITGVDRLRLDINKNTATLNIDGQGEESFSTGDIHVISKDINGQPIKPTLLVAGYSWNGETKTWEVYNPGFPMDSPKDELAWFNQADIANGNWLRWHQRVIEGLAKQNNEDAATYMKNLFAGVIIPDNWVTPRYTDKDFGGQKGAISDFVTLDWMLNDQNQMTQILKFGITKEQQPMRGGLSYGYLVDSGVVVISLDVINGDKSTTSLPLIMDDVSWTKHRGDEDFTRTAYAAGKQWDPSMTKDTLSNILQLNVPETWLFSAIVLYYPDSTVSSEPLAINDLKIIEDPQGITRREATINGNIIEPQASLDMWGGYVKLNAQEALKIGK